jgi:type 2 lantibiotic biosynthesis protein LanM
MTGAGPAGSVQAVTAQSTSVNRGRQAEQLLEANWWARGLALHERCAGPLPRARTGDVDARARLERWRAIYPGDGTEFAARLAAAGIDEDGLLGLLAESPDDLAGRVARPAWADIIERAVTAAAAPPQWAPGAEDWREAFAIPLHPLTSGAADQLVTRARRFLAGTDADLASVAGGFTRQLSERLVTVAARAMVLVLNVWRGQGRLDGTGTRERFADFIDRLAEPAGLAGLFAEFPVLARLLGQACQFAVDTHLELLARFSADRRSIVDTLLAGADPGPVLRIHAWRGDTHQRGRSVAILEFADGRRVVYKPRDVRCQVQLALLADRLNQAAPGLDLRVPLTVVGAGYGWTEFVEAAEMSDPADADTFYRKQGALLALLHVLHASDVHCENLIARADQPVLVDAETMFHPTLPGRADTTDPATMALRESVHRTALLPLMIVGENGALDMSGLGGDRGATLPENLIDWEFPATDHMRLARRAMEFDGALNRPRLAGRELDPCEHETALLEGFRLGYDAIARNREDFRVLIESWAGVEIRIVVRETRGYATLLDESTHPEVLRDALDRDRVLDLLWTESSGDPLRWPLSQYEAADLWAGDVPYFAGRPANTSLWTSDDRRLPGQFVRTGMQAALDKLAAMGEVDRRDQEWIISATLATRQPPTGHRDGTPVPGSVAGTAAQPDRLLASACAIADGIVARSIPAQDRVNWLGLELVDETQWLVLPMGAGLAHGYLGVALFLAQLAELSAISRYGEVALDAIQAVPTLFDSLAGREDLLVAIGCGGLYGLGGIGYGLARLAVLLSDNDVRDWATYAVSLAEAAAAAPGPLGWAGGQAGCLAAMTAVQLELGSAPAGRLARASADRLLELMTERPNGTGPDGFADGVAGIGWALGRFAEIGGDPRYAGPALDAVRRVGAAEAPGWCSGSAGLELARLCGNRDRPPEDLDAAVGALADRPVLRDLSLCHGELGVADVLTVLANTHASPVTVSARRRRAGLVLDAIDRYGPTCGTPRAVSTPGLLNGLAGIGWGLLRLGFPDRVPSVLLLEPTPGLADGRPTVDTKLRWKGD